MPKFQYDVFLSHNSEDKPAVEWLAAKLGCFSWPSGNKRLA